jgi:hypothetical protein
VAQQNTLVAGQQEKVQEKWVSHNAEHNHQLKQLENTETLEVDS